MKFNPLTGQFEVGSTSSGGGGGGSVDSVNGKIGAVVLNADDIDDTATAHKFASASELTKLSGIASGAEVNTVTSVASKTGAVTLTKTDVGLGSVDNTADINKPVSTAQQTALDAKQNTLVSGTTIKTVNSTSLLGSGNIEITGGGGGGDMSSSTYDPANGARQVAFNDQLPDTSDFETTTQLNTRDANNRDRTNHTGTQAQSTVTNLTTDLAGKANTAHTHPTTDLTATGGTSTSYLRKDNTWATPTNTTYTEITEAEITAGTASTLRTMTGRRAGFLKDRANHTGAQTASTISDFQSTVSSNADVMANSIKNTYPAGDAAKLSGIEAGATANSADSSLRDRTYHTGTQPMSTISDAGELATQNDTDMLAKVYPVGSIYIATVATNPATLFGFGTWAAYGEGRVMVGKAGSGTFGTAGTTGGEETVNLQHNHGGTTGLMQNLTSGVAMNPGGTNINHRHSISNELSSAQSILQPYIVAYMWERTA